MRRSRRYDQRLLEVLEEMRGLVFFDCDGVLTRDDSSWRVLHEYFGSRDNTYFAQLYKRGIISYLDWMKIDVALMIHSYGKPIRRKEVVKALSSIEVRPEASLVVKELKRRGFYVGVISSGVDLLVKRVCREVGSDICLYNELMFVNDELVPGGKPWVPLHLKPYIIEKTASSLGVGLRDVVYVGDSSWDIQVFEKVGLSIAVEPCGEACSYADHTVKNLWEILGILEKRPQLF